MDWNNYLGRSIEGFLGPDQSLNEEVVVSQILFPLANVIDCVHNITNVGSELQRVYGAENGSLDLLSKDNLERIRVFKGRWLDQLKNALDKELFSPRGWIDLLSKNEAMSDQLRRRGNNYFIDRSFEMALRAYTLAGMYAPKDSKSLALSYSNRSACFAVTNRWNKCLEDISRFEAIWNKIEGWPTPTGDKVAKRKEKCLKKIGDKKEGISVEKKFGNDFFKLKIPSHVLPSAEGFLGVKTDPKKGRGIYNVSDKAIEPGTLLILDDPYAHVFNHAFDFKAENCSACYRILGGSGIPCGGCVFNVYCSEACATSAHHVMHAKYGCKLAPYLFEIIPKHATGKNIHLALSVLLKLGPNALLDHYRQVFNKNRGVEIDKDGSSIVSYLPIFNLIYHEETLCEEKLLWHSNFAVVLTEVLDFCTDYFTCLNLDELEGKLIKEEFARRLLLHEMCLKANETPIGYFDWPEAKHLTLEELKLDPIDGLAVYPAMSLLNHSCAPNSAPCSLPGGVVAVIAQEFIVPGQEILVTYLSRYPAVAREERRKNLQETFGFKCECTACSGNWPLMEDLKSTCNPLGSICPKCRMKFEFFHNIGLEPSRAVMGYVCPRKCGFQIHQNDLRNQCVHFSALCERAMKSVDENKIVNGFMDAKKCVQFFDAHFSKPGNEVLLAATTMEKPIHILARRMFD